MPARAIKLLIKDWRSSRKTCTSTYTSKTTFCSLVPSTWKPRPSEEGDYGYVSCRIRDCIVHANRSSTLSGANPRPDACARRGVVSPADGFRHDWTLLHDLSRHVSRRVEPPTNQRTGEHRIDLSRMAPG